MSDNTVTGALANIQTGCTINSEGCGAHSPLDPPFSPASLALTPTERHGNDQPGVPSERDRHEAEESRSYCHGHAAKDSGDREQAC